MRKQINNKKRVSAIIFDWGGVFSYSGDPLSRPEIISRLKTSKNIIRNNLAEISNAFSRGKMKSENYWTKYAETVNIAGYKSKKFKKLYLKYTPNYGMLDLLRHLSLHYPIVLLSNLNVDMKTVIIKDLELNKYFKHMIFSNDVGLLKPDPTIYKLALQKLGTLSSETLFIDDETENVDAAKKLGLRTILFKSERNCRIRLRQVGIIK